MPKFAAGKSPRAIAITLNAEGVPGPQRKHWGPSTIYGNWRRGTGVVNNELYIGKLVWNRQRFVKDPATGKRQARANPCDEWVIHEAPELGSVLGHYPELRILDDRLWNHKAVSAKLPNGPDLARTYRAEIAAAAAMLDEIEPAPAGARPNGNELLTAPCQAEPMPIMMRAGYRLTATRGKDEILRRSFDDRDQANQAIADALVRYHDSEVRLSQGDAVFISAGPGADKSIIAPPR